MTGQLSVISWSSVIDEVDLLFDESIGCDVELLGLAGEKYDHVLVVCLGLDFPADDLNDLSFFFR